MGHGSRADPVQQFCWNRSQSRRPVCFRGLGELNNSNRRLSAPHVERPHGRPYILVWVAFFIFILFFSGVVFTNTVWWYVLGLQLRGGDKVSGPNWDFALHFHDCHYTNTCRHNSIHTDFLRTSAHQNVPPILRLSRPGGCLRQVQGSCAAPGTAGSPQLPLSPGFH